MSGSVIAENDISEKTYTPSFNFKLFKWPIVILAIVGTYSTLFSFFPMLPGTPGKAATAYLQLTFDRGEGGAFRLNNGWDYIRLNSNYYVDQCDNAGQCMIHWYLPLLDEPIGGWLSTRKSYTHLMENDTLSIFKTEQKIRLQPNSIGGWYRGDMGAAFRDVISRAYADMGANHEIINVPMDRMFTFQVSRNFLVTSMIPAIIVAIIMLMIALQSNTWKYLIGATAISILLGLVYFYYPEIFYLGYVESVTYHFD